jgi:hypothetical protein
MTTTHSTNEWTAAVRERPHLGCALPLGEAQDATWLFEQAATTELRRAGRTVAGAAPGRLRIDLVDWDSAGVLTLPAPPSALPPGPLRIDGEFAALPGKPLPALAEQLRQALFTCAVDRLGLHVTEVDLRVTELLESADASPATATPVEVLAVSPEGEAALTAAAVPGVAHLTRTLGSPATESGGHVWIELATAEGHHPLHVAQAIRTALTATLPDSTAITVVITAVNLAA